MSASLCGHYKIRGVMGKCPKRQVFRDRFSGNFRQSHHHRHHILVLCRNTDKVRLLCSKNVKNSNKQLIKNRIKEMCLHMFLKVAALVTDRMWLVLAHSSRLLAVIEKAHYRRLTTWCDGQSVMALSTNVKTAEHDLQNGHYPRDAMLARVFATATCPSVCPSVRTSVTRRYYKIIVPSRAKAGSRNVHHDSSFRRGMTHRKIRKGSPPKESAKWGWVGFFGDFRPICRHISKTVHFRHKVTIGPGFQGHGSFKRWVSPKRRILQTQLLYRT